MIPSLRVVLLVATSLGILGSALRAQLVLVEQSTETIGATTVTWDSSFEDLDYTLGEPIVMTVDWTVDEGTASFVDFRLRFPDFTPKGPDPADGELLEVMLLEDTLGAGTAGSVEVVFRFNELHFDEDREVDLGNAHFSLFLDIDTDGDGNQDSVVGYGTNTHVEDPLFRDGFESGDLSGWSQVTP